MERRFSRTLLSRWRSSVWLRLTSAFVCLLLINSLATGTAPVPGDKPDSYPGWWFEREVIPRLHPNSITPPSWNNHDYPATDDYSAINLGQLKYFASKAADELNAHLHGGAGSDVNNLIAQWSQPAAAGVVRDDFAAVNLGQLKTVAKPFYDRLIAVRYTSAYPWATSGQDPDDFALANLGQVKYLFSFDLTKSTLNDGLPDWWVIGWNLGSVTDPSVPSADPDGDGYSNIEEFNNGTDPTDFYNGQQVVLAVVSGDNQSGMPGTPLAQPIVISVTKADGTPWTNAPVTFSVDSSLGGYSTVGDGSQAPAASLVVRTDSDGHAQVYFQPVASLTGPGFARASSQQVSFTVSGYDPNSSPSGTTVLQTTSNGNNQTTLSWNTNSTNGTGTVVQRWTYGTGWVTLKIVSGGTNNYTDTSVPSGAGLVAYQVATVNNSGQSNYSPPQSSSGEDLATKDTDGDGIPDAEEIAMGGNPNDPSDGQILFPSDPDMKQLRVPERNYAVVDLTALGVKNPSSINDSLQILDVDPNTQQSILWSRGVPIPIPDPPDYATSKFPGSPAHPVWSTSMSNSGMLATTVIPWKDGDEQFKLYTWSPNSSLINLTYTSPKTTGMAFKFDEFFTPSVSSAGYVACAYTGIGSSADHSTWVSVNCCLLWTPTGGPGILGPTTVISSSTSGGSTPSGSNFIPTAINDSGIAIGTLVSNPTNQGASGNATLMAPGVAQGVGAQGLGATIPYSPGGAGGLSSINSNPTQPIIVGWIPNTTVYTNPARMWASVNGNWKMKSIEYYDPVGKVRATANGIPFQINNRCEIVGYFTDTNGVYTGSFWQNAHLVKLEDRASSDYSNYTPSAINNNGVILASAIRKSDNRAVSVLLVPLELMVDGNRDGKMNADDAATHNADITTADRPFRFWINDDQDSSVATGSTATNVATQTNATIQNLDGEIIPVSIPDSTRENIQTVRDLEDWSRIWIDARSIAPMLTGNQISAALQFLPPDKKLFRMAIFRLLKSVRPTKQTEGLRI